MKYSSVSRSVIALCYLAGLVIAWDHGRSRAKSLEETEISIHAATQQFGHEVPVTEGTLGLESSETSERALIEALIKKVDSWPLSFDTVRDWAKVDPLGAITYFENSANASKFMKQIMATWGNQAPFEASSWLAMRSNSAYFDSAVSGLSTGVAQHDPEGAIAWTQLLSDRDGRYYAFGAAGNELFRRDPQLAGQYLEESGFSEERQAETLRMWIGARECRLGSLTRLLADYVGNFDHSESALDLSSKENFVRQAVEAIPHQFSHYSCMKYRSTINELEVEALLKRVKLEGQEITILKRPE